ncbi:hypothetical protein WME94_56715 [Sorangium sp. So ce429]
MIREAQAKNALYAINEILVRARTMAFEGEAHEKLANLLDAAEELPMLMAREEDTTNEFRSALEGLAAKHPELQVALDKFERGLTT